MSSKKLHLVSLGCNKNLVDSEVMLGRLAEYELTNEVDSADVIIVNTCGFIEAAKAESVNTILDMHENRKQDSLLVVSGCLSERYQEELAKEIPEVDIFTGVGDYARIDELISLKQSSFTPEVYLANENSPRVITGSKYHAYVKLSEGCNQTCSFCAIPSFKGKLQSRKIDSVVAEVQNLISQGFRDFSFISQDTSSFGRDLGNADALIDLIAQIELLPGIKSARILYLYPSTTTIELIDAIANSSIFKTYYDMPIQHITDHMLKVMKRGFGKDKTVELLKHMRNKANSFVRTAVIAGHPQESEADFIELKEFLENFGFDRVTVFEYSNEENTTAYNLEQIPQETISQRATEIGEIAKEAMQKSQEALIGKNIRLIIDGESDEHEFLLTARPTLWAPEIDGEVLINDTSDLKVEHGEYYIAKVSQVVEVTPLATLIEQV